MPNVKQTSMSRILTVFLQNNMITYFIPPRTIFGRVLPKMKRTFSFNFRLRGADNQFLPHNSECAAQRILISSSPGLNQELFLGQETFQFCETPNTFQAADFFLILSKINVSLFTLIVNYKINPTEESFYLLFLSHGVVSKFPC